MEEQEKPAKAGSPVLGDRFLKAKAAEGEATFTAAGAVNKTGFLVLLLVLSAAYAWSQPEALAPVLLPLVLLNFGLALGIIFVPASAPFLAPVYALLEGLFIGVVSVHFERLYQGIVFQAALGTVGVLGVMAGGYAAGIFKFGARMKAVIIAATLGMAVVYLGDILLSFFGRQVGLVHSSGPYGIAFTVFALVVAALNLSLDFDFIGRSEDAGLSKRMEWYAGFGVLITLVWIYIEMLRLLSKIRKR